MNVVPFGPPGCAVATVAWSARKTGDFDATCERSLDGASCSGSTVRNKAATIAVAEQPGGAPVEETVGVLRSPTGAFTDTTFYTLCRVAFHAYPQPLTNYRYDVEIE